MAEFKGNSYVDARKEKDQSRPKPASVVSAKEKRVSKLAEVLELGNKEDIGSYILADVIIPSIKDVIVEMINAATEMYFYGGTVKKKEKLKLPRME